MTDLEKCLIQAEAQIRAALAALADEREADVRRAVHLLVQDAGDALMIVTGW